MRRADAQTRRRAARWGWFCASARLCVCALLVSCGSAQWREADARLNAAAQLARAQGYTPLSGPHNTFGNFAGPGSVTWRTPLEAQRSYFIAAACTSGCDTLDFSITEPQGRQLAADTTTGPTPRLSFTAPEEGDYRITFRFGHCRNERCRWVAQVYGRTNP